MARGGGGGLLTHPVVIINNNNISCLSLAWVCVLRLESTDCGAVNCCAAQYHACAVGPDTVSTGSLY